MNGSYRPVISRAEALCSQASAWPFFAGMRRRSDSLRFLRLGGRAGQAAVEYAVAAGILTAMVAILAIFLYVFREYGGRVLDLVASEYP
jgi:hypothetical protein